MDEYDKKMMGLRKGLPQVIDLGGKGEAGTGKITVPKGMSLPQEAAYREAIGRRRSPGSYAKFDEIKKQAQEATRKKLGKKRPTYFPQETRTEEGPRLAARKLFEDIGMGSEPVSSDELTEAEKKQNELIQIANSADLLMKSGSYDNREEAERDAEMMLSTGSGVPQIAKKDPIKETADVMKPFDPAKDTRDQYGSEEFGMDASEKNYAENYEDQDPVSTSYVIRNGAILEKQVFDDGSVFFLTEDGDPLQQHSQPSIPEPRVEQFGEDSKGRPMYQQKRQNLFDYSVFSGEDE